MAFFKFQNIKIAGMAAAVPKNIVKTESFKDLFGAEEVDKFISMTGITETRRTTEFQTASDLACTAASNLLSQLNVAADEIGALVFGTTSPDYRRPASAFVLQKRLGIPVDAAVFDINLGCSSLLYGLQVVASMMANSDITKALLLLGDTATKTTHPEDRASIMIVGDTGVALLIEKTDESSQIQSLVRSDGSGYRHLIVPGGGYRNLNASREVEICADGNKRSLHHSFMQGTSVFTFTISDVPRLIKDFWAKSETTVEDYDIFAFHQANLYILKQIAKKLQIPLEKLPLSISKYGNTSGASPVLTLCENFGNSSDMHLKVMLCGFGVGLSWGVSSVILDVNTILPVIEDDTVFEEGIIQSVKDL